jgi:hypothetical protein
MAVSFAAVVFRPAEVSDRALSQGFAVALAGWDLPSPHLAVAPLTGIPGYAVAFFSTGKKSDDAEAFDLACELFEEEIPPALGVLDAAQASGQAAAQVYAVTYAEGIFHDDVCRYDADGWERHYLHEGEDGAEAAKETPEGVREMPLDLDHEPSVRELRGTTFLAGELGAPALPALVGALWATERRVAIRLVDPGAEAIAEETRRLLAALHRTEARGAFAVPGAAPASYAAFARTYDWADPSDPRDLYRELAIGAIEGTLHFHREAEIRRALDGDGLAEGLYPIARLEGSALGGGGRAATLALAEDGEHLRLLRPGSRDVEAGPTFGELLRYLALGWTKRSDAEEDMIGALMLRAKIRAEGAR